MIEEEVPYEEDAVQEEAPEEAEILVPPEPPVLKRSSKEKLQDRVECPDCSRQVSRHTLLHTHRCPAKKKREAAEAAAPVAVTEPVPAPEPVAAEPVAKAPKARAKRAVKATVVKPALPEAEVQKPLKQRTVIKRAEKAREYTSAYATSDQPQDLWSQLMMQRQMQSRMRAEAVASPYAQMFAAQRSRVM